MPKEEWGVKRECPTTGKRFYDLNKDPVISPYTGKVVELETFKKPNKDNNNPKTQDEVTTNPTSDEAVLSDENIILDDEDTDIELDDDILVTEDDNSVSLEDIADVPSENEED